MRIHALALLAAVAGLAQGTCLAASSSDIEAKVALESSIERRLQSVLEAVLGSNEVIVIVNAELLSEADRSGEEVMPGVPPKEAQAIPGVMGLALTMVRRVSATVLIDQGASDDDIRLAKQVAANVLGISPERGDGLTVERMRFHGASRRPRDWITPQFGLSLSWLALAAAALLFLHRGFWRPFLGTLADLRAALGATRAVEERQAPEPEAMPAAGAYAAPGAHSNGASSPGLPFSFVSKANLPSLIFLLRQDKPLSAATILQYIPAECAAKALAALDPPVRREVVSLMSRVTQLDEGQVKALEEGLHRRIDYLMGGEEKLAELLGGLPSGLQQELLEAAGLRDAQLTQRLRERIVFLEDLAGVEASEFKALSRRVTIRTLAVVFKHNEALGRALMPKLAQGMREWLQQEIEIVPRLPLDIVEAENRRVLDAFSQLLREGRVTLRKAAPRPNAPPDRPRDARPPDSTAPPRPPVQPPAKAPGN